MQIRPLQQKDKEQIIEILPKMLLNSSALTIIDDYNDDEQDYSWGSFIDGKLVGMAHIGYTDEFKEQFEKDWEKLGFKKPDPGEDVMIISEVEVLKEYRKKGIATNLIKTIIEQNKADYFMIQPFNPDVSLLYEKIGFKGAEWDLLFYSKKIKGESDV